MTIDWRPYKNEIVHLHESGKNLKVIQEVIAAKYNFKASRARSVQRTSDRIDKGWKKKRAYEKSTSGSSQTSLAQSQRSEQPPETEFPSSHIPTEESERLRVASQRLSTSKWGPEFSWMEQDIDDLIGLEHPLHWALRVGDEDAIPQLIADGADPNLQAGGGLNPLHIAVREGKSLECITGLVKLGAGAYQSDDQGNMPLHWAVRWNWEVHEFLVDNYFSVNDEVYVIEYENGDGFNYVHLVLICYRLRLCTPTELAYHTITFMLDHSIWVEPQLPTGEWPLDHITETLSRDHDFSKRKQRMAFWDSVISGSPVVPHLNFWGEFTRRVKELPRCILFPGSSVGFLDSLLTDLPLRHFSQTEVFDLAKLGASLLDLDSRADDVLINMLIDTQASRAWQISPGVILRMAKLYLSLVTYNDQNYMHETTSWKSNRSFLLKAIEDVKMLPEHQKDHIAYALVCGGNGFSREVDGRIPVVVAATKGLRNLVNHMFDEDQKGDRMTDATSDDVQVGRNGRYH